MSGLLGLSLIYLSWFEYIFDEFGVVPSINRWEHPESTWRQAIYRTQYLKIISDIEKKLTAHRFLIVIHSSLPINLNRIAYKLGKS